MTFTGEIIPFPESRRQKARLTPVEGDRKALAQEHSFHAPTSVARFTSDTLQRVNRLAQAWFMIVDQDLPNDLLELSRSVFAVDQAVANVAADFGGIENFRQIFKSVSVYLGQPTLSWRRSERSTHFDLTVPGTVNAKAIQDLLRTQLPLD